jgi:predicted secreted acid phosphatase
MFFKKPELSYQDYVNKANHAFHALRSMNMPHNPVVIFDIDDTVIDSNGNSIMPIIGLCKAIIEAGIPVIFITARLYIAMQYTIDQLENHGIKGYFGIYFRNNIMDDVVQFKKKSRQEVVEKLNKAIIMSVGDQLWDLAETGYNVLLNKD